MVLSEAIGICANGKTLIRCITMQLPEVIIEGGKEKKCYREIAMDALK